jgi:hypothetical protein
MEEAASKGSSLCQEAIKTLHPSPYKRRRSSKAKGTQKEEKKLYKKSGRKEKLIWPKVFESLRS